MTNTYQAATRVAFRILIVGLCCLGIRFSWQFCYADYLAQQDTGDSVRHATEVVPDAWEYFIKLAALDPQHSTDLLSKSLQLNEYNAQADIELGFEYEDEGKFEQGERYLLAAYEMDHTYVPRWSLTDFYFRRKNAPQFWAWARKSAEMPSEDIEGLFDLCWEVSPNPALITSALLNDNPVMIRQYIWFLLGKNQPGEAAVVAPRLISLGKVETDRPQMLSVVDRLVASNKPVAANQLWHSLVERNWVTADATVPNNRRFAREPLPVKFDWSIPEYSGLHSWPGPSGLESEFTGVEPEDCTVAEQFLVLSPGKYTMSFTYRTSEIPPDTGLTWEVVDESTNKILGESHYLSAESLRQSGIGFEVAAESSLLRLRLHYRRVLGTPRISGKLVVESTEVQKIP